MTMMIMMIIITFCALDILILEFLPCKWQLVLIQWMCGKKALSEV